MVPIDKVLFRLHDDVDVCEIHLPDANNVAVFPANEVVAGSDPAQTFAQTYKAAFDAYKAGKLQPFEIAAQEAAAAPDGDENRGAVSDVETAQSNERAADKPRRRQAGKKSRKPAKKAAAPAKTAKKKAAKKAAKSKR